MSCIDLTLPPLPPLPLPFHIPELPPFPFPAQPKLCCQLPDIVAMILAELPPIPLPPDTINIADVQVVVAAMQEAMATVQAYIDALIPPCPKVSEILS